MLCIGHNALTKFTIEFGKKIFAKVDFFHYLCSIIHSQTKIRMSTFKLTKEQKKLVAKNFAESEAKRIAEQEQVAARRKEILAERAEIAAEQERVAARRKEILAEREAKQAAREALKTTVKQYGYLTVGENVYQFPKTPIIPTVFKAALESLGLNPNDFKLAAVKPKGNATTTEDIAIAVQKGSIALASVVTPYVKGEKHQPKKIAFPNLVGATDRQIVENVSADFLGIWVD